MSGRARLGSLLLRVGPLTNLPKNEMDNFLRLQGQYEDRETGLYYNRHRYFCPIAGSLSAKIRSELKGQQSIRICRQ